MKFICKECLRESHLDSFDEIVKHEKVCDSCRFKSLKKKPLVKNKRVIVKRFMCSLCKGVTQFMPYNHKCECGGHVKNFKIVKESK